MPLKFRSAFFISLILILIFPFFFPSLHLLFFAPTLVIAIYRGTLLSALWKALFCGLVFDLLSSSTYFGLTSLNYTLSVFLLYRGRRHFFEDNLSTLPLMTLGLSVTSSILQWVFSLFFGARMGLNFLSLITNFFLMPLFDALMAFLLFSLPFYLYKKWRKIPRREE